MGQVALQILTELEFAGYSSSEYEPAPDAATAAARLASNMFVSLLYIVMLPGCDAFLVVAGPATAMGTCQADTQLSRLTLSQWSWQLQSNSLLPRYS